MATAAPLTQKQEDFCHAIVAGKNMSEAYRSVYNTKNMTAPSVHQCAHELMNNPKVTSRIEAIRRPAAIGANLTLEGHLSELNRLKNIALDANKPEAAIRAEELRGKASGLYVTKVETGNPGEFAALNAMRKQDAIAAIQNELDRRARLANGSSAIDDVEPK
jgi:hypothetical protein